MKKYFAMMLAAVLTLSVAGCGEKGEGDKQSGNVSDEQSQDVNDEKSEGVMTHAEYVAAADDTPVVIETYVQDKQSWWQDKATIYTQDRDGAYFIYEMTCSEEDYAKLTPGTKIRVTGYRTSWEGEIEVASGATFEILEGSYVAEATDVTSLLGKDELIDHQNEFVSFKGMTVEDAGNGTAFMYKDEDGSDIYFKVSLDGVTYDFVIESYLRGAGTEVYEAVKGLKIGDVVDMEGFLYWYRGVNPHITSVTVK